MGSSQKRAIQNYRSRLSERGLARFEVLGRDADRDLVRSLARRLADGPDASRLRAAVSQTITVSRRRKAVSLPRCADPRSSEPISTLAVLAQKDARWRSDAISARYEHHQKHREADPVEDPCSRR